MTWLFIEYGHTIIFLHVLSAIIWLGGMITVRIVVHPIMQTLESPMDKLGKSLLITGRLFSIVMPFIMILLITGFSIVLATDGHYGAMKTLFIIKEAIWTLMTVNFAYMYFRHKRAMRYFNRGELPRAKDIISIVPSLLLPVNIILGIVALWFGVSLRGA